MVSVNVYLSGGNVYFHSVKVYSTVWLNVYPNACKRLLNKDNVYFLSVKVYSTEWLNVYPNSLTSTFAW